MVPVRVVCANQEANDVPTTRSKRVRVIVEPGTIHRHAQVYKLVSTEHVRVAVVRQENAVVTGQPFKFVTRIA